MITVCNSNSFFNSGTGPINAAASGDQIIGPLITRLTTDLRQQGYTLACAHDVFANAVQVVGE